MTKDELKALVVEAIDAGADDIIGLGETVLRCPELGYKEHRTAALVAERLTGLGLSCRTGLALTGVKARLPGAATGPAVAVLGELDAVVCPGHRHADPVTGAAHACGHHGQLAAMYGAARGLVRAQAGRWLAGAVVFMAVPAEEYVELEYRQRLRREGQISFFGGKQELLARGEFADVDLALMVHQAVLTEGRKFLVGGTSNGFVGKLIRYRGREAHAGGAPHAGVNALNAAILGLMGVHLLRETFRDEDSIRVHPIITKGGDLVNVIPADVRAETYVRGRILGAIIEANRKVNRALRAGAAAIGAEVEITELPGYLPRRNDARLDALFRANAVALVGEEAVGEGKHGSGSSDMGDIMHVMPGIHPTVGGCEGRGHSEDFGVCDPDTAYVLAAKALALTVVDLLWGRAEAARDICRAFDGQYSREEYLRMWAEVLGTAE